MDNRSAHALPSPDGTAPAQQNMAETATPAAAAAPASAPGTGGSTDGLLPAIPADFRPVEEGRRRGSTVSPGARPQRRPEEAAAAAALATEPSNRVRIGRPGQFRIGAEPAADTTRRGASAAAVGGQSQAAAAAVLLESQDEDSVLGPRQPDEQEPNGDYDAAVDQLPTEAPETEPQFAPLDATAIDKLTVSALKERLRARSQATSGNKGDLAAALKKFTAEHPDFEEELHGLGPWKMLTVKTQPTGEDRVWGLGLRRGVHPPGVHGTGQGGCAGAASAHSQARHR
jgi:hypothetical protein